MSSALVFSAARRTAYCATSFSRFLFRLIWLVFAIGSSFLHKRELEAFEKRLGLRVGLRRRVDDDVHAPHRFGLVVVDLDEDDVFLEAHRIIALAVEARRLDAAEVSPGRHG